MLIKVTNFCSAGCSHCMEESTKRGSHMTRETFDKALAFTRRLEGLAWRMGAPPLVLLSGGECSEHPDLESLIETTYAAQMRPMLITNGSWLADPARRASLLRPEWASLLIQVTHDPRFYPTPPPEIVDDKRIVYVDKLTVLTTLGRAKRKALTTEVPQRRAPSSFNIRSITRSLGSVEAAIAVHRMRAAAGLAGHCSPSVSDTGDVVAGESNQCFKIGTVDSTAAEITTALVGMQCNRCGHVDNLTLEQKRAIGESSLVSPYETAPRSEGR